MTVKKIAKNVVDSLPQKATMDDIGLIKTKFGLPALFMPHGIGMLSKKINEI